MDAAPTSAEAEQDFLSNCSQEEEMSASPTRSPAWAEGHAPSPLIPPFSAHAAEKPNPSASSPSACVSSRPHPLRPYRDKSTHLDPLGLISRQDSMYSPELFQRFPFSKARRRPAKPLHGPAPAFGTLRTHARAVASPHGAHSRRCVGPVPSARRAETLKGWVGCPPRLWLAGAVQARAAGRCEGG